MLLKETKKVQRKYGLSTYGSYVVQLASEMNDMDAEFIVLTEGSEQTGELLTEAIGLLLLFGAAMAAMYFGSGAIKSIFNQGSSVSKIVTNQKEQQSLTNFVKEKISKTGDKNQALKELKEKLEKDGKYSEEEIEEILKAFLGGFEDAEEEKKEELTAVQEAIKTLKDDNASDEDKSKAKKFLEDMSLIGANSNVKNIDKIEDLLPALEEVEKSLSSNEEELKEIAAEGNDQKVLVAFAEQLKKAIEAAKPASNTVQPVTESIFRRWQLLAEGEDQATNDEESPESLGQIISKYNGFLLGSNEADGLSFSSQMRARLEEIGVTQFELSEDIQDISGVSENQSQEEIEEVVIDLEAALEAGDSDEVKELISTYGKDLTYLGAISEEQSQQLSDALENQKSTERKVEILEAFLGKADLDLDAAKQAAENLQKRVEDLESDNQKLSASSRQKIDRVYEFIKAFTEQMKKSGGVNHKKFANDDRAYPKKWDDMKSGTQNNFKAVAKQVNNDNAVTDFLGGPIKFSEDQKDESQNESHKKQGQAIIERWNKLAGLK